MPGDHPTTATVPTLEGASRGADVLSGAQIAACGLADALGWSWQSEYLLGLIERAPSSAVDADVTAFLALAERTAQQRQEAGDDAVAATVAELHATALDLIESWDRFMASLSGTLQSLTEHYRGDLGTADRTTRRELQAAGTKRALQHAAASGLAALNEIRLSWAGALRERTLAELASSLGWPGGRVPLLGLLAEAASADVEPPDVKLERFLTLQAIDDHIVSASRDFLVMRPVRNGEISAARTAVFATTVFSRRQEERMSEARRDLLDWWSDTHRRFGTECAEYMTSFGRDLLKVINIQGKVLASHYLVALTRELQLRQSLAECDPLLREAICSQAGLIERISASLRARLDPDDGGDAAPT